MTWPYLVSGFGKFDINAHNVLHSGSNSIKITFLNSFSAIYVLFGFAEVRIFPLFSFFLVMTPL